MKPLRETLKPRPGPVDSIEKEIAHDEVPARDVNADMINEAKSVLGIESDKAKAARHAAYKALPAKAPRDRLRITREERVVLGNLPDYVIRTELARREMAGHAQARSQGLGLITTRMRRRPTWAGARYPFDSGPTGRLL